MKETMRTKTEEIGASLARKYLGNRCVSRSLSPTRIAFFTKKMLSTGGWKLVHQGLAFDDNGTLLDGQHRLSAVINADLVKPGVRVSFRVSRGVDSDTVNAMDRGQSRSSSAMLTTHTGSLISNAKSGCVLAMLKYNSCKVDTCGKQSKINTLASQDADILCCVMDDFKEGIDFVNPSLCSKKRHMVSNSFITSALAKAFYYTKDKQRLIEFMEIMKDGFIADRPTDPRKDSGALRVRNFFQDTAWKTGGNNRVVSYLKATAGIKAFLDHEFISKLLPLSEDPFPLLKTPELVKRLGEITPELIRGAGQVSTKYRHPDLNKPGRKKKSEEVKAGNSKPNKKNPYRAGSTMYAIYEEGSKGYVKLDTLIQRVVENTGKTKSAVRKGLKATADKANNRNKGRTRLKKERRTDRIQVILVG